jgi:PST family polysaccharide transporter
MIQRILRNFSWLSVAAAFELGLGMLVTAVLARRLGPTGFGQYSLWLAFIAFFTPLYDFGLTAFSLREVAQSPQNTSRLLRAVATTKIFLSTLGLLVVVSLAYGLDYFITPLSGIAFLLLTVSQIVRTFSLLNRAVFRAYEWMNLQAYIEAVGNLVRLLLILGVILVDPHLIWVCLVLAVVNFSEFLVSSIIIQKRTQKLIPPISTDNSNNEYGMRQLLNKSTPFALYDVLNGLYMRADTVLVGTMVGVQAVAWYSSAYKLATLVGLISRTLMDGIYPILCKQSQERVYQLVRKLLIVFLCTAFPICLSVTLLGQEIIEVVYGAQYTLAIKALQILVWGSFFVFGSSLLLATLNALHFERTVAKIMGVISITGLIAYLLTIPIWGYLGACVVSAGIEMAGFLLMLIVANQKLGHPLLTIGAFIKLMCAYGIAGGISWIGAEYIPKFGNLIIALLIYCLVLLYTFKKDYLTASNVLTLRFLFSSLRR